jgi:hypothetical protein
MKRIRNALSPAGQKHWHKDPDNDDVTSIMRWQLVEMLEAFGCTASKFPSDTPGLTKRENMSLLLPVSMPIYIKLLKMVQRERRDFGWDLPGMPCKVKDLELVAGELDGKLKTERESSAENTGEWLTTGGKTLTVGVAFLTDCFPLHSDTELAKLTQNWGRWSLMWSCTLGPDEVRKDYMGLPLEDGKASNLWTAWREHLFEQPLDDIRDYFGDHVAIYFAWLGMYTSSLLPCAILGVMNHAGLLGVPGSMVHRVPGALAPEGVRAAMPVGFGRLRAEGAAAAAVHWCVTLYNHRRVRVKETKRIQI